MLKSHTQDSKSQVDFALNPTVSVWDCSILPVCVLIGIGYFLSVVTETLPLQQILLYLPVPGVTLETGTMVLELLKETLFI